jgi:hypothetical protein
MNDSMNIIGRRIQIFSKVRDQIMQQKRLLTEDVMRTLPDSTGTASG